MWIYNNFVSDAEGTNVVPVYIVSIDYNKYCIGYECKYDAEKNLRHGKFSSFKLNESLSLNTIYSCCFLFEI